jgi:hypothetical protein
MDDVAYVHGALGITVLYYFGSDWAVGPSFDARLGTPLFSANTDLVGRSDASVAVGLVSSWQLWKTAAVWLDARYATSEEIYAFDTDFRGKPQSQRASRDTVAITIGVMFGVL